MVESFFAINFNHQNGTPRIKQELVVSEGKEVIPGS